MYIAIDVGGTSSRVSWSNSLDAPTVVNKVEFLNTHNFEEDYSKIIQTIKKASNKIDAIGIGFPGDLTKDKTMINDANHNREWENKPFVKSLSDEFNCPVYMDNDAAVAAFGPAYYGEGKNKEFAYITWGTGLGGAIVTKHKDGVNSIKLDWYDYFEKWEEKCGGRKIEENYGKTGDKLTEEEWNKVIKDFISYFSIFIKRVNPKVVIFGGGITTKQKHRLASMNDELKIIGVQFPEIYISSLGEDTGLYGAFGLIKSQINN